MTLTKRAAPFAGIFRGASLLVLTAALGLAGAYAWVHGRGNFHEVEKGVVYRSALPGAEGLERAIGEHGVKSVLNLCGEKPESAWYADEVAVARRHGVTLVNLELSAESELAADQVAKLVAVLREAPKPLLIHCRAGADRTGLASALYVASQGGTYHDASAQLSVFFGHFPYLGSKTIAMDVTLERYFDAVTNHRTASLSR